MRGLPRNTILTGDALAHLRRLPGASVDCVITSPPYFQLRDYGVAGQLGLEASVDDWVAGLRRILAEVSRVLKPTGAVWLNLGDSYSIHPGLGAPRKSYLLGPERLLVALVADGWLVRNRVAWIKPNPLPTSATDRLRAGWEFIYLLVRSPRYYFDLDAIREPHRTTRTRKPTRSLRSAPALGPLAGSRRNLSQVRAAGHPLGKNPGDAWTIAPEPYGGHGSTFPRALVRRPLLATCPPHVCAACGAASRGGQTTCSCRASTQPGIVLDPFLGSGSVAVVARDHDRDWLGIELNPVNVELAWQRLGEHPSATARRAA